MKMSENKEIFLDAFIKEAVVLIADKLKKHDLVLNELKEEIHAITKKLDNIYSTSPSKAQPMDVLIIERLKMLEEKVNRLEMIVNSLRIPSIDKEILEKLK